MVDPVKSSSHLIWSCKITLLCVTTCDHYVGGPRKCEALVCPPLGIRGVTDQDTPLLHEHTRGNPPEKLAPRVQRHSRSSEPTRIDRLPDFLLVVHLQVYLVLFPRQTAISDEKRNFSPTLRVFNAPAEGVYSLEFSNASNATMDSKTRVMALLHIHCVSKKSMWLRLRR